MGKKKQWQGPDIGALAERCAALGCAPRLAIVAHLAASGPTSVNDLGEVAGISVSGVSQHLVKLKAVGAVVGKREAQTIRYELVPGWIEDLILRLGDLCGFDVSDRVPLTAELVPIPEKIGTAGKRRKTHPARPDGSRSDDHGSGKGEVATGAADAQEGRPDAQLVDSFIDPPEADEIYPEEAGGTAHEPDGGVPAYSPGPSYGGAR